MYRFFIWMMLILPYFVHAADIAVVTLAAGDKYKESVRLGIENKRAYCEKHGYDFICCEEILDSSRAIPRSKILLVLQTMENSDYKWIFWTDADSLIMNYAIKLEQIIDNNYNFIISKDFNVINSGQFLIRNCPWSQQFLLDVYAHTECVNHPWWENQAIILEFEQKAAIRSMTKVIPQRIFNSYPKEINSGELSTAYQHGDFVLHFAGFGSPEQLQPMFEQYTPLVIDDPSYPTLDQYLSFYGFRLSPRHTLSAASPPLAPSLTASNKKTTKKNRRKLLSKNRVKSSTQPQSGRPVSPESLPPKEQFNNEGYMSSTQKEQFNHQLKTYTNIRSIAEIGLNGGHSAENFFTNCAELDTFVSFDLQEHSYARVAKEYFYRRYQNRFLLIEGDSAQTVPQYSASHPDQTFDLIYIDGCHTYENCLQDILNFQHLTHENTIVWVDDFDYPPVRQAVEKAVEMGIIKLLADYSSADLVDGNRGWAEARYLLPQK